MIGRLLITTIAIGGAFMIAGMVDSTFRHYYHKHADQDDLKTNFIQEVVVIDTEVKE
jgi:hypothetical protein